ncbi:MAG: DUF1499 domain-containing protein [Pseudomonadota bacterium]
MKTLIIIVGVLAALVLLAMAYVRFTPVGPTSGVGRPAPQPVGDYPSEGGFYAVRPGAQFDQGALEAAILAEPRVTDFGDGVYATRTAVWAFPDIVHVWQEGDTLHVSSHLVYGRRDFAMNRKRVESWLDAARIDSDA